MRIEHVAIWANDIESVSAFYVKYFGMERNHIYTNAKKQFTSYFLRFPGESSRIEVMNVPDLGPNGGGNARFAGLAHLAICVGSKDRVLQLTEQLRADGVTVLSEPRTTGDGYFESAVADPEGNYIEITAES